MHLWLFLEEYEYGLFLICLLPALIHFNIWAFKAIKNNTFANYTWTMRQSIISCIGLNLFFFILIIIRLASD
jgi:hypothetical protein